MLIIGLDYRPSVQQIAFLDLDTGEIRQQQLYHSACEVEQFYREFKQRGLSVRLANHSGEYHGLLQLHPWLHRTYEGK